MADLHLGAGQLARRFGEGPPCLEGVDLILGGVNLHEDLHFSTFYLRASLSSTTLPDYPGYSFILAVYEQGVERYYISAHEAERTSQWLIDRSLSRPGWLAENLHAIEVHTRRLAEAFPCSMTAEGLRGTSTDDLLALYLRHNALHSTLYRFARIPEALDRGKPFFSDYLRAYLRDVGVSEAGLSSAFLALTTPRIPSVIAEEERAFGRIAVDAALSCAGLATSHTPDMFLPSAIREALRLHREQWGWLSYHGYRDRALPSEHEYIRRLCGMLGAKSSPRALEERPRTPSEDDDLAHTTAGIDAQHRELFRLYSEIGRVKLFRRYWQLRNFYYLDQLLAEFAHRLDAPEWEVRCCLPEELLTALREGRLGPVIKRRVQRCVVLYCADGEFVTDGDEALALLGGVRIIKASNDGSATRSGTPACIGFARGTARIVVQNRDRRPAFQKGEVLVCEAADPDLLPMIRQAAAVVTQQGGVTSHASVLCREIGVPTVIGVEDLLTFVSDGDLIEVDATRGVVRRIEEEDDLNGRALIVPRELWDRPECVGQKAANLQRAISRGFKVPPFSLLSFEIAAKMLDNEPALRVTLVKLCGALDPDATGASFLLRSSAHDEDGPSGSRTGTYVSVPLSMTSDPIRAVQEFVDKNRNLQYQGVIIFQRFLLASTCGVSIEGDSRADAEHKLIVEFARGPLNTVTEGRGHLERIVLDQRSGEVIAAMEPGTAGSVQSDLPVGDAIEWLSSVGRAFGKPTYTEWGFCGGEFWLYQVRATIP